MKLQPHRVRQGEYLSQIAHRYGLAPEAIWSHDRNKALREARMSREILLPGDVLWVPIEDAPKHGVTRGSTNEYKTTVPTNRIRIVLHDGDKPMKNERYLVAGLDAPLEGKTNGEGLMTIDVPFSVSEVSVTLIDRRTRHLVRIGHLDPIESESGVRQRLAHLGYYGWIIDPHPNDPIDTTSDDAHRAALQAFQTRAGLTPTGSPDDETLAALLDAHGS